MTKAIISKSIDYQKQILSKKKENFFKIQPIFHDLETLSPKMTFNMKQYPNTLKILKKYIKENQLLYLSPKDLEKFKEIHALSDFELTIFYQFEKEKYSEFREEFGQDSEQTEILSTKIHNVFVIRANQPVLVLYNPFQHKFKEK